MNLFKTCFCFFKYLPFLLVGMLLMPLNWGHATTDNIEELLKQKLSYTCPLPKSSERTTGDECKIVVGTDGKALCLDIRKTIGGKKHQVIAIAKTEFSVHQTVLCNQDEDLESYVAFSGTQCKNLASAPISNTNQPPTKLKLCEW